MVYLRGRAPVTGWGWRLSTAQTADLESLASLDPAGLVGVMLMQAQSRGVGGELWLRQRLARLGAVLEAERLAQAVAAGADVAIRAVADVCERAGWDSLQWEEACALFSERDIHSATLSQADAIKARVADAKQRQRVIEAAQKAAMERFAQHLKDAQAAVKEAAREYAATGAAEAFLGDRQTPGVVFARRIADELDVEGAALVRAWLHQRHTELDPLRGFDPGAVYEALTDEQANTGDNNDGNDKIGGTRGSGRAGARKESACDGVAPVRGRGKGE